MTTEQPEAEPMETESDRLRDAVRKALRQGENVLTAEEAADLDLGKTTIHQVMVKRRQESYAALQAYGDARAREQDAKIAALTLLRMGGAEREPLPAPVEDREGKERRVSHACRPMGSWDVSVRSH